MRPVRFITALVFVLVLSSGAHASRAAIFGENTYTENLVVGKGDKVSVTPGASLSFGPGVGIIVEGALEIKGLVDDPVKLSGTDGNWAGITVRSGAVAKFGHSEITGADTAVDVEWGKLELKDSFVHDCNDGITVKDGSEAVISGMTFLGIKGDAVRAEDGSWATVSRSNFKGPGGTGVRTKGKCRVSVSGATFEGLDKDIVSDGPGSAPKVTGCEFRDGAAVK